MWYGNGIKKEEGLMRDGKEISKWFFFKENGDLDRMIDHD